MSCLLFKGPDKASPFTEKAFFLLTGEGGSAKTNLLNYLVFLQTASGFSRERFSLFWACVFSRLGLKGYEPQHQLIPAGHNT
ncbi:hypothetical protein A6R70_25665 [Agrobacterium rubi]|nr:hypothetical protein [Agrobacterium rubi]